MASSSIVLLVRMKVVPGRSAQAILNTLYESFVRWLRANGKTSSLEGFSLLKFKMKTLPTSCCLQLEVLTSKLIYMSSPIYMIS